MTYWDDLSAALRKKAGENPLVESAIAVLSFLVSTILTVFMVGLAYFILQYICTFTRTYYYFEEIFYFYFLLYV